MRWGKIKTLCVQVLVLLRKCYIKYIVGVGS